MPPAASSEREFAEAARLDAPPKSSGQIHLARCHVRRDSAGRAKSALHQARTRLLVRAQTLAAATSGLAHLLPTLDRRLHVVTAALELAENTLRCHTTLEVLDRALDAFVSDLDFERLAGNGFARIRQGTGLFSQNSWSRKPSGQQTTARPARSQNRPRRLLS